MTSSLNIIIYFILFIQVELFWVSNLNKMVSMTDNHKHRKNIAKERYSSARAGCGLTDS